MSLELRTAKGEAFELSLEGVYDNLGLAVFHLKDAAGNVRTLELEITEYRSAKT